MSRTAGGPGGAEAKGHSSVPSFRPGQREKIAPCQSGCATSGDVRSWVGIIAQREKMGLSEAGAYARAWRMITDVNPFPSVMGRVCPHPCEDGCNRSQLDQPVAINAMERFLGDWALAKGLALEGTGEVRRKENIGVIGAGPSGLSFAFQMAKRGYPVTVYEEREEPGGMLRYGIPDYRLPPEVLDAEIARILNLGVELRTCIRVGQDLTLDELRRKHDALFLGVGAQRGRGLGIPGEEGDGVWKGTDYLRAVNRGEDVSVGASVAVVGGGNTAVDAARAARRAGAEVTLLYRRSREEMPAIAQEVEDALEEGVELMLLAAPVEVVRRENGKPLKLLARRMRLGEPDASGRKRPEPIVGSEFHVPVDTVIAAVSQEPDLAGLEELSDGDGWLVTDETGLIQAGVWAGGDALGLGIAGFAIAQGRRAAEALHERICAEGPEREADPPREEAGPDRVNPDFYEVRPRARPQVLSPAHRLSNPRAEVAGTISEAQFLEEAERCFSCGSCFGCQQCSMYCTTGSFIRLDEVGPGFYFALSLDECEECGKCVEVCPCGFLEVTNP